MTTPRKTIQTYIDIDRASYKRFVALATLGDRSAAKILGDLVKKYLTRNLNQINDLEAQSKEIIE